MAFPVGDVFKMGKLAKRCSFFHITHFLENPPTQVLAQSSSTTNPASCTNGMGPFPNNKAADY
ncbi:hypothetical protein PHISCL_09622 [Aspergillus sclerotialis]|uniref:Uncharacterized protein n=1 Tax=Aspergillus sclerotialis TaxID=2070753 RepID=A0A3A2Z4S1_9EURO|nr:hypothetical protein PHISCL_09622 [Aspergillus sclerotialis]